MHVINGILEWLTGSKKRKLEDEMMDRAADRMERSLAGLRDSNTELQKALENKEIHVKRCRDVG